MTIEELTPRQVQVAHLLACGWTDKAIAGTLAMKHSTVRVHVAAIAYNLGLPGGHHTRVMIARWWLALHPESLSTLTTEIARAA
jgi:DNA-binding NarL/FixJ family response regulator